MNFCSLYLSVSKRMPNSTKLLFSLDYMYYQKLFNISMLKLVILWSSVMKPPLRRFIVLYFICAIRLTHVSYLFTNNYYYESFVVDDGTSWASTASQQGWVSEVHLFVQLQLSLVAQCCFGTGCITKYSYNYLYQNCIFPWRYVVEACGLQMTG